MATKYTPSGDVVKVKNTSTGSLFLGFQGEDRPEDIKAVRIVGPGDKAENRTRDISAIMGSRAKGWFVTAKGTGPLPVGEVEVEIIKKGNE